MVWTFFGSLEMTPLPSAACGAASGGLLCAGGIGAGAGLFLIATGCSSRETIFSSCA